MKKISGGNAQDMKSYNRLQVLELVCTRGPLSRGEIARQTELTKMTASNIISELISASIAAEEKAPGTSLAGRRPGLVELSPESPLVCGVFIGRRSSVVLLADLSVRVQARETVCYADGIHADELVRALSESFQRLKDACRRKIIGIGISAPGPLNARTGMLLSPPDFYGIANLPIRDLVSSSFGLPCVLLHDVSAAALAEKLYGGGQGLDHFLYLQLADGIGAGIVANSMLFDGDAGLSGELGHTSINFEGPPCKCGNYGCLERYANEETLLRDAQSFAAKLGTAPPYSWREAMDAADRGDSACISALGRYCEYVAIALANFVNLVDLHHIFVGREGGNEGLLERLLEEKLNQRLLAHASRHIHVQRSLFGEQAPVVGAAALAAQNVFCGELPLLPQ